MSIDRRSRLQQDVRDIERDEVFDSLLPQAISEHGPLAGRGVAYKQLPPVSLRVDDRAVTLRAKGNTLVLEEGDEPTGVTAEMPADAMSDLIQDHQSTMGLAMTSRVKLTSGNINEWIGWEPAFRALLDGRRVHETGDVTFRDLNGDELNLNQRFSIDDDRDEIAHFLREAGFLHLTGIFEPDEMDTVGADIDEWIAKATPDDGESWWAKDKDGVDQAVRVLFFLEKSAALREIVQDERYQWLTELTGDGHRHNGGAEGLVKPLGIVQGLSDLPWHKDCGQGRHSYMCNGMTTGISVTGADRVSGALGVIPGSHRANTMATGRDPKLDLQPQMLETNKGDVTVHCSDTLHRAHPPIERPRKVVYSSFGLPPLPGDVVKPNPRYGREARAELTDVTDRIAAADNENDPKRYRASR